MRSLNLFWGIKLFDVNTEVTHPTFIMALDLLYIVPLISTSLIKFKLNYFAQVE